MEGKIALEEHFAIPETINPAHDARYASWFPAWPDIKRRLLDLQELRLPEMDKHGIELVILGLHNPAVQGITDPSLLVPGFGIYAGAVGDRRAAVSIGINPHYGGTERRVEAYLLDWEGDLYGDRLVVELWRRLRDERAFASEADLVAQIAEDVEQTRASTRP